MVGLNKKEVDSSRPSPLKMIIIIVIILISIIVGTYILIEFQDPYASGTYYGTIEPKYFRKIKSRILTTL